MWGQVNLKNFPAHTKRIIPTRMGTRSEQVFMFCSWQDHPHAYGDKTIIFSGNACFVGSSPRVWGQETLALNSVRKKRIIPTRMGTSRQAAYLDGWSEDHPHAYGDKPYTLPFAPFLIGSSPRVWGQVFTEGQFIFDERIIPTRMGTRYRKLSCYTS